MKILYKLYHSVFACLMLTTSVGMVYAFSMFIPEMTERFGTSRNCLQFAFSLSIFFLGTGAACFGNLVERNVKASALVSTVLFPTGLYLTHLSIQCKSIFLLYLGIGVFCGLAEGIAYLCPVKNMVLWFSKSRFKGMVMAVSIVSFGLGASLCAFFYGMLYPRFGLDGIFAVLSVIYLLIMALGTVALRKPKYSKRVAKEEPVRVDYSKLLHDPYFLKHWMFMLLNITMGLILIGNRKSILMDAGIGGPTIITVFAICGFTNAFGRLLFPFIGDLMKNKLHIITLIMAFEFMFVSPSIAIFSLIPLSIILVEAGYGGMFACAPQILLSQYGSKPLSICHGLLLQSWGVASILAFLCTFLMSKFTSDYYYITILLGSVYGVMSAYSLTMEKSEVDIIAHAGYNIEKDKRK